MKKKKLSAKDKNIRKIKSGITNALELPKEIMLNLPLITLIGKNELTIENYKNLIEYNPEKIRLNTSSGILKIEGKKLFLKEITSETVIITGAIMGIEYLL